MIIKSKFHNYKDNVYFISFRQLSIFIDKLIIIISLSLMHNLRDFKHLLLLVLILEWTV